MKITRLPAIQHRRGPNDTSPLNEEGRARSQPLNRALAALALGLAVMVCTSEAAPEPVQEPRFWQGPLTNLYIEQNKATYLDDRVRYEQERAKLVEAHFQGRFCAGIKLTNNEATLDGLMSKLRHEELERYRPTTNFPPTRRFYDAKADIQKCRLFAILKQMPKGGLLHTHLTAAGRMDWIITNATYLPDCYVGWPLNSNDLSRGKLTFNPPLAPDGTVHGDYFKVAQLRTSLKLVGRDFDAELRRLLMIGPEDYYASNRLWAEFGFCFDRIGGAVTYQPVFTNYLFDAFQTLWDDGVFYVELRVSIGELYDRQGNKWQDTNFVNELLKVRDRMQSRHPEFDLRLIVCNWRGQSGPGAIESLKTAYRLRKAYPDFIVGYDLVGEEDATRGTRVMIQDLFQAAAEADKGYGPLNFFFHDGESAWADNTNVFDALLFATNRLAHGFNLFHFPTLYDVIRKQDIALEICPISNQLLHLAQDLRTHPASGYLNAGLQCVLGSDDPAIFGNDGLSYDFWEAYMAWNLDLAALKKLARNSIEYSELDYGRKHALLQFWEKEWAKFIESVLEKNPVTAAIP